MAHSVKKLPARAVDPGSIPGHCGGGGAPRDSAGSGATEQAVSSQSEPSGKAIEENTLS